MKSDSHQDHILGKQIRLTDFDQPQHVKTFNSVHVMLNTFSMISVLVYVPSYDILGNCRIMRSTRGLCLLLHNWSFVLTTMDQFRCLHKQSPRTNGQLILDWSFVLTTMDQFRCLHKQSSRTNGQLIY